MNVYNVVDDIKDLLQGDSTLVAHLTNANRILPIWAVSDEGVSTLRNPEVYSNGILQTHIIIKPGPAFHEWQIQAYDVSSILQQVDILIYSGTTYKSQLDAIPMVYSAIHGKKLATAGGIITHWVDYYPVTIGDLESQRVVRSVYEVNGIREL